VRIGRSADGTSSAPSYAPDIKTLRCGGTHQEREPGEQVQQSIAHPGLEGRDAVHAAPARSDRTSEQQVDGEAVVPHIAPVCLALIFLWMGSISIGGRSASYILDELVHRRHWLRHEDWLEALTLGRVLPGSSGQSCAAVLAQRLGGSGGAALSLVAYVLPGALLALLLSIFFFGPDIPPQMQGLLKGFSAAAIGMVLSTTVRTARSVHMGWIGITFAALTFLAYGLLEVGLLIVLLGLGGASIFVHRPRRKGHD
jgi:chromate transporter